MIINSTKLSETSIVSSTQNITGSSSNQEQDQDAIETSWGQDEVTLGSTDSKYMTYTATSVAAANSSTSSTKAPSIYDMTNEEMIETLKEVEQQLKKADYTGMSDVEIYQAINQRYTSAFGSDFMDKYQLSCPLNPYYGLVAGSYENELNNQFGSYGKVFSISRQANYGDMSSEEITKAIMSKYPPTAQQTYQEAMLMTGEMKWAGVDDGCLHTLISETADMLCKTHFNSTLTHKTYTSEEKSEFERQLLDEKVDPAAIGFEYNAAKYAGRSMSSATSVMMNSIFGISLGANGMYNVDFDPKKYFSQS